MKAKIGEKFSIDLVKLLDTRLLIQANSGGGKSWAIRKLLETTHGEVQQIVLDIEGDFPSLREKFDYILAGKGGDIPADPKSAGLLARKILELQSDLIVDLYELKQHDRIQFVRLFLEAMINAPKDLWHPVLIVIDEAHIFAPEHGKAESLGAVIDLLTRGRKRGMCAVLATQRLSKLHKDAAAECNNKMIGRTGMDIDMKRAGDELGMTGRDTHVLRTMEPGEFYVFGPALSSSVDRARVGSVLTQHPKAGKRGLSHNPPATAKVKGVLSKLTDLPKEAEAEAKTVTELQEKIRSLGNELKRRPEPKLDPKQFEDAVEKAVSSARREADKEMARMAHDLMASIRSAVDQFASKIVDAYGVRLVGQGGYPSVHMTFRPNKPSTVRPSRPAPTVKILDDVTLGACERKILGFLLMKEGEFMSKVQIGAMTGYAHGSGNFSNSISSLTKSGLILKNGSSVSLNPEAAERARALVGDHVPHRLEDWIAKLGACERKVYERLLQSPDREFSKQEIAEDTGYAAGSGNFSNAISRLSTLGLLKKKNAGVIQLNEEISSL